MQAFAVHEPVHPQCCRIEATVKGGNTFRHPKNLFFCRGSTHNKITWVQQKQHHGLTKVRKRGCRNPPKGFFFEKQYDIFETLDTLLEILPAVVIVPP